MGGHLVTINDREEELWLRYTFGPYEFFWIGFNDIRVEGYWEWVSGEPVTYTNWALGEPNDCFPEGEDAAVMNWVEASGVRITGFSGVETVGVIGAQVLFAEGL